MPSKCWELTDLNGLIDEMENKRESEIQETEKLVQEQKGNLNPDANLSSNANIRKQITKLEKYVLLSIIAFWRRITTSRLWM